MGKATAEYPGGFSEQCRVMASSQTSNAITFAAGVVEAWAGGSTWDQIIMDCSLDDGDIARLLNRQVMPKMQMPETDTLNTTPLARHQSLMVPQWSCDTAVVY